MHIVTAAAQQYPIEVRAKAHRIQHVEEAADVCILEPDSSLQLVVEGAPDPAVNNWTLAENVAEGTALRANLEETASVGESSAGLAVAIDVDQFEEVLGAAASAQLRVLLVSGYELRVEWKPIRGQHVVEVIDPSLARPRQSTVQELEIQERPGSLGADRFQAFDCELVELTDMASIIFERSWGRYEAQWRGVAKARVSGSGLVVFPKVFYDSRYCVIAISEDGALYGREFFTCTGARVVMLPEYRNRVKGSLRQLVQAGEPVYEARLEVLYEGTQLDELNNLATRIVIRNEAGDFDVAACREPLANEGVPFPAPRAATVRVTAPGLAPWEEKVVWPENGATVDLGVIVLAAGADDILLHPLRVHRDSSWHAVYPQGGKKEHIVTAARRNGDIVSLSLEAGSQRQYFEGMEALLVSRDALFNSISGFIRVGEVWSEVEQSQYAFDVTTASSIAEGEVLALGLEWRGVQIPFGTFDAADFRGETGSQHFELLAPSEGLRLWGQRRESSGKSQGFRTEIDLLRGASRHVFP